MAEPGLYLYAVSRGLDPSALAGQVGIDDAPLLVVSDAGLDAVVSAVDLDEFGEEGLRRNLEDLAWLERVARGHDEAVHAIARHGPTAPLRLATVCLDDGAVRGRLGEWHDQLSAALDRVQGRSEWSVKLVAPVRQEASTVEAAAGPGSGAAYLQRKRQQSEQRLTEEQEAVQEAERVYRWLAGLSVASRRLQPQDARLSGHHGLMTLNAAFLVADDRAEAFSDAVTEVSAGVTSELQVAGPWPPYSFATLETP